MRTIRFVPVALAAACLIPSALSLQAVAEDLELLPTPGQPARKADPERPANGEPRQALPAALLLASFDVDGDYRIDAAELQAGLAQAFARADADASADVSPLEYADWAERALGGREAHPSRTTFDVDLDGRIVRDEFFVRFTTLADGYGLAERGAVTFADLTAPVPQPPAPDNKRSRRGPLEDAQRR